MIKVKLITKLERQFSIFSSGGFLLKGKRPIENSKEQGTNILANEKGNRA